MEALLEKFISVRSWLDETRPRWPYELSQAAARPCLDGSIDLCTGIAGTNIQTGEEVGIKLVRGVALLLQQALAVQYGQQLI